MLRLMNKSRIIIIIVLIGFILPEISQLDAKNNHNKSQRIDNSRTTNDTFNFRLQNMLTNDWIFPDTILRRPLYKIDDEFMERLIQSTFILENTPGLVFFLNPEHPDHYLISSEIPFFVWSRQNSATPISLDSIDGIYSTKGGCILAIYGVEDSILNGFGFEKITDTAYIKIENYYSPLERFKNYYLAIVPKKRDSNHYKYGIFCNGKLLEYNDYKELRWIKEMIKKPRRTDICPQ